MSTATPRELAELVNSAKLATLGKLVAGVAHELNTPMGALNSNHDTIKRALNKLQDILADEVVEPSELNEVRRIVAAMDGILRVNDLAIDRMRQLVGSLRSFGRPDQAEIDRVDLHQGIDAALAILRHELKDRIEIRRDYGELPLVECYPNQLGQVFMNLLANAVQAISGRGEIRVRTAATGEGVTVEVEDTGVGIAEEHMQRIFEPGFTTKGSRMGMGLGLLIAQQIVERHAGSIDVRSTVGKGTIFTVALPLRLPSPSPPAATPQPRR